MVTTHRRQIWKRSTGSFGLSFDPEGKARFSVISLSLNCFFQGWPGAEVLNYVNFTRIYLQQVLKLATALTPSEINRFANQGYFTVRRSNKYWSGNMDRYDHWVSKCWCERWRSLLDCPLWQRNKRIRDCKNPFNRKPYWCHRKVLWYICF